MRQQGIKVLVISGHRVGAALASFEKNRGDTVYSGEQVLLCTCVSLVFCVAKALAALTNCPIKCQVFPLVYRLCYEMFVGITPPKQQQQQQQQ